VIGVLGVHPDVSRRVPIGLRTEGSTVLLLGRTGDEFGGSAWAQVAHGHCGGHPPTVDLAAERALAALLTAAAAAGLLDAAHDLSEGGLAIALAECCVAGGLGCQVTVPGDVFTQLFSESAARAVVAVRPGRGGAFAMLAAEHGVPVTDLGVVRGDSLVVTGSFDIPVDELAAAHRGTLPALFG
jgi:phosphoribosylformylglycinamidine synthase